mgnify:CR=1 FL=1
MKQLTSILLLFLVCGQALSQKRPKLKNELPKILQLPSSGQIAVLNVYKAEDPEDGSIDLQMGVVYEKRFRDSDILTEYKYKYGNAMAALKSIRMARIRIDERDVRKNEEHYFNFGTVDEKGRVDVDYDTIRAYMEAVDPVLSEFLDRAPGIYAAFTNSFSYYDEAHKQFTNLIGGLTTRKDLLLLYGTEMDQKMEEIKTNYLKAIDYFRAYQDSIKDYPISYDQQLIIKDLEIYRLDGLESQINFLKPTVEVWNYAKWVDDTRSYIEENIDQLRTRLAQEDLRVNRELESATPDFIREEFDPLKIDKELLFTLRKFDLNSVVEPIFLYKQAKHDLIHQELIAELVDTSQSVDIDRKLYLYGRALNKVIDADTLLQEILNRNTEETHSKYPVFLAQNYGGRTGITSFVTAEQNQNKQEFEAYVDKLRAGVFKKILPDTTVSEIKRRRTALPFMTAPQPGLAIVKDGLVTTHKLINFDSSAFIGGVRYNESEEKIESYIAGITNDKKIGWFNQYLLQIDSASGNDAHTRVAAMGIIPGGVALVLHGKKTDAQKRVNQLMIIDESGELTMNRRIPFTEYPRTITYNDRENSLIITFKGKDYQKDIFLADELIVSNFNILGDLKWQQRIEYKGDIVDLVPVLDGYALIGNYNTINDLNGRIVKAGETNTETEAFALRISNDGIFQSFEVFEAARSYFVNEVYKVSDDCINLIGVEDSYRPTIGYESNENFIHLIVNNQLQILHSSIK